MKLKFRNAYAASFKSSVLLIRQGLPLAVVGLGLLLTGVWVIFLCWMPFRVVVSGVQLALGETFSAAFAAVP